MAYPVAHAFHKFQPGRVVASDISRYAAHKGEVMISRTGWGCGQARTSKNEA